MSEQNIREFGLQEHIDILTDRNYPIQIIENVITRATQIYIKTLRHVPHNNTHSPKIWSYISTYNLRKKEAFPTITQSLLALHEKPKLREILHTNKIIKLQKQPNHLRSSSRRQKKIKDNWSKSKRKCGCTNCAAYPNLLQGPEFLFRGGQKLKIKTDFTCVSENLLYVIKYSGCHENYIRLRRLRLRRRCTLLPQQIVSTEYRMISFKEHIKRYTIQLFVQFINFPSYKCMCSLLQAI